MPDQKFPSEPPTRPTFYEEEIPTLITCLACGGQWQRRYKLDEPSTCSHCEEGYMTRSQAEAWKSRKDAPGAAPDIEVVSKNEL